MIEKYELMINNEPGGLKSLFCHQTLDSLQLIPPHKTLKAARLAMADRVVLNRTNTEILASNTQKKK